MQIGIGIGGLIISFLSCRGQIPEVYHNFFHNNDRPDLVLEVHYGKIPNFPLEEKIFDSKALWSCYKSRSRYIFKDRPLTVDSPNRVISIETDFNSGDIYTNRRDSFPFQYPLDEIVVIKLLSQGHGVLLHACGVIYKEKGLVFCGTSGAGKSTLTNLWIGKRDATLLSDDRIIIRRKDGKFWTYGTPWHGDAKVCSPEKAPLEKIFFLKHAKKNIIKKIEPLESTARLIVCSFPTFWDKKGMEFTLKFCAKLAQKVPCYELGFVPDERILDLIKKALRI